MDSPTSASMKRYLGFSLITIVPYWIALPLLGEWGHRRGARSHGYYFMGVHEMKLSELELLYLRRLLVENLESLNRGLQKNLRIFGDSDDVVMKQRKIGNLEAEIAVLSAVKEKVNLEIGKCSLTGA